MEEQWINDLRKKMAEHQTPPPPGLWEGIDTAMKSRKVVPEPFYRRKALWWTSLAASAAVACALWWTALPPLSPSPGQDVMAAASAPASELLKGAPSRSVSGVVASRADGSSVASGVSLSKEISKKEENATYALRSESNLPANPLPEKRRSRSGNSGPSPSVSRRQLAQGEVPASRSMPRIHSEKHRSPRPISLLLYATRQPRGTGHSAGYGELTAGTVLPRNNSSGAATAASPAENVLLSNRNKEVHTHTRHQLPVKAGLTFCYALGNRWSVESGITYTLLSSRLISGTESHYFSTRQRLHYLGIPLNVNYGIWKGEKWNIYASAGGALEKCISGRHHTDFVVSGAPSGTTSGRVREKPPQWALGGALGLQWNIGSMTGVYLEPGAGYYFNNGSGVATLYKDHPFHFSVKLGIRLALRR